MSRKKGDTLCSVSPSESEQDCELLGLDEDRLRLGASPTGYDDDE